MGDQLFEMCDSRYSHAKVREVALDQAAGIHGRMNAIRDVHEAQGLFLIINFQSYAKNGPLR
jgi:hypothetical protein|tara:strand:- start:302 stop:487 length:186 start_codon:yes stop_codon:yes gene_type:complete